MLSYTVPGCTDYIHVHLKDINKRAQQTIAKAVPYLVKATGQP